MECTCLNSELAGGNVVDGSHWIPCPEHDTDDSEW